MSNIAIIPARGGSTRIPLKNCLDFHGKPIIQYSILTAQRSGLFDVIVVSTDHPKIAEAAHQVGAVVMWRPANLCQNEVGTQKVTAYVLEMFEGRQPDLACCIYPTAPLMTASDLRAGRAAIEECRPGLRHVGRRQPPAGCWPVVLGKAGSLYQQQAANRSRHHHDPYPGEQGVRHQHPGGLGKGL